MRTIWKLALVSAALAAGGLSVRAAEPWTLPAALAFARTNSPDARLADQRMLAADAAVRQANATLWPTLRVESSYVYTDNPMMAFGSILNQREFDPGLNFNRVPGTDNLNVRGALSVPLYAGGSYAAAREAARQGALAARQLSEAVDQWLAFEVTRVFHTVQKAGELVRATEAAVAAFATNTAVAHQRETAGTLLKADVLDLEVRLAQAREDLVRARNGRRLALRALQNLLGFEEGDFTISEDSPAVAEPETEPRSTRPELLAAQGRERAAEAQVRSARAGYLPRVSAVGTAQYDHGWHFNGGGDSYSAGAVLQWDLWDGQLTRGRVSEARANLETAREEQRKLRLALDLEREQARLALEEANGRLAVTDKAVEQAGESVALTRARFAQGLALPSQLIDAETALTAARVRRAEAEADRRIAIAALRRALALPQLETERE